MANPNHVTDFVETDLGRPRADEIFLLIGKAVERDECGLAAKLRFAVDKSKDRGADVMAGNAQGQSTLTCIGCQGIDYFSGIVLTSAVLVGVFRCRQIGPYIGIQAHHCLEVGGHHGYNQFIDSSQGDDVQMGRGMFSCLLSNDAVFPDSR